MNSFDQLDRVRITDSNSVRSAAEALLEMATSCFDCRVAVCHNIAVQHSMCDEEGAIMATEVFGWTDDDPWWQAPQLALTSPLPEACRYEAEPFWANADGIRTTGPNPWMDRIDLSDFETRALTKSAIIVPIHMPFGSIGAAGFNPVDRSITDLTEEFNAYADFLGFITRTFVTSYHRAMVTPLRLPESEGSLLSKREVECLKWAALGKTDTEIAAILSRSRATIRFHIQNARVKLDTVNRSQTVFKATQLGYISSRA